MSASLLQSEFVYRSGTGNSQYTFTIVSNSQGSLSVRDIQNPYGFIISPYSTVPQTVTDDINAAMQQVGALLATSSAANGTLVFASENSKTFTFPTPLASSTYRVQLTTDTFVPLRIAGQTTTSFTIQASATFTGTVGFDVFI
jgi:hypothetical protein